MPRAAAIALPELKLCKNSACSNVATGYTGYCYSCDSSRSLRNYSSSPTPRSNVKHPMGVEIECYNPESLRKVTHVAEYVCSDASLPDGGGEIKLCSPEDKLEDIAADTVQRSRIIGNLVNKKCGLHVHMKLEALNNRYSRSQQAKNRLYSFAKAIEPYMFDISAKSRKENQYCRKLYDEYCLDNHHSWITCSSRYPTIEVRIHGGTMNPWKVKGWLNAWKQIRPTLDKVANGEDNWLDYVKTVQAGNITDLLNPNSIGYKYIKAREQANGNLESFGFSSAPSKKKELELNAPLQLAQENDVLSNQIFPTYSHNIFRNMFNQYADEDKLYYTVVTTTSGIIAYLALTYNHGIIEQFYTPAELGLLTTSGLLENQIIIHNRDTYIWRPSIGKFRKVKSTISARFIRFDE